MKKYTTCVVLASIFLIWWVQPTNAQGGYGLRPIAPINCKGARCPGGEVTDPSDEEEASTVAAANERAVTAAAPSSTAAPAPAPDETIAAAPTETTAKAEETTAAPPAP